MTKEQVIKRYHLDNSHKQWDDMVDNWYSVEAFRQQTGLLPNDVNAPTDSLRVMMDFLDNKELHLRLLTDKGLEFGSMYLSAKRYLMRHIDKLNK